MKHTHTHHIVPRHAGGTDEPSNLIELSISEHAEAHRVLFETHGRWQDNVAWKTLSGQLTITEAQREAQRIGRIEGGLTNVKSGHLQSISSKAGKIGGKTRGPIQGKANVASGHWANCTSLGGKRSHELGNTSKAGKLGCKTTNRRVMSIDDGKITTWGKRSAYERKTGYQHTWIDL